MGRPYPGVRPARRLVTGFVGGTPTLGRVIPSHLDDFWTAPRLAVLGTTRPDGTPHLVPVKAMRVEDELWVLTRPETVKCRHVRQRGWASLAEHSDTVWATVEGTAGIDSSAEALQRARAAYRARFGRTSTWGTCVLVVRPQRVLCGD